MRTETSPRIIIGMTLYSNSHQLNETRFHWVGRLYPIYFIYVRMKTRKTEFLSKFQFCKKREKYFFPCEYTREECEGSIKLKHQCRCSLSGNPLKFNCIGVFFIDIGVLIF